MLWAEHKQCTTDGRALLTIEFSDHSKVAWLLELVHCLHKLLMLWTIELVSEVLLKQIRICLFFCRKWNLWTNLDEERRFMYDCHPQLSHQLPFDQGVQIVTSPSSVVYVQELIRVIESKFLWSVQWPIIPIKKLIIPICIDIFIKTHQFVCIR